MYGPIPGKSRWLAVKPENGIRCFALPVFRIEHIQAGTLFRLCGHYYEWLTASRPERMALACKPLQKNRLLARRLAIRSRPYPADSLRAYPPNPILLNNAHAASFWAGSVPKVALLLHIAPTMIQKCVVFFTRKFYEKVIDTSTMRPYYRGSLWVKKLYRKYGTQIGGQKQTTVKNST